MKVCQAADMSVKVIYVNIFVSQETGLGNCGYGVRFAVNNWKWILKHKH